MTTRIRFVYSVACALVTVLVLVASAVFPGPAFAAVSAVYTAATNPTYENPVTGVIEDAAGTSNVALGESMVASVVYQNALIERDTDGTLYASLRIKLADQISSISFEGSVDGAPYEPLKSVQMQTGTDSSTSTATADYRVAIPSTSAILRCSMDVIPMGRTVTYFIAFGAQQQGNTDGTFVQSVVPGQGSEDAAPASAGTDASASSGGADDAQPDKVTSTSSNAGVQEFDEEGREVTGDKPADVSLDGGTVALILGVAAGVVVVAGVVVYVAYLRPKRARQAAAAAAAANDPACFGSPKPLDTSEAPDDSKASDDNEAPDDTSEAPDDSKASDTGEAPDDSKTSDDSEAPDDTGEAPDDSKTSDDSEAPDDTGEAPDDSKTSDDNKTSNDSGERVSRA